MSRARGVLEPHINSFSTTDGDGGGATTGRAGDAGAIPIPNRAYVEIPTRADGPIPADAPILGGGPSRGGRRGLCRARHVVTIPWGRRPGA